MSQARSAPPPRRASQEFWAIIAIGVSLVGLNLYQFGGLRSDHREDMRDIREEISDVRDEIAVLRQAVIENGKVLARIEQALFGPPPKEITPAGEE